MISGNERLPDLLRPTELHDFGDVFGASGAARKGRANALFAVAAVTTLTLGIQHLTNPIHVAPSPAATIAAR